MLSACIAEANAATYQTEMSERHCAHKRSHKEADAPASAENSLSPTLIQRTAQNARGVPQSGFRMKLRGHPRHWPRRFLTLRVLRHTLRTKVDRKQGGQPFSIFPVPRPNPASMGVSRLPGKH